MRMLAAGLVLVGLTGCASTNDDAAIAPTDVEVTMNCRVADRGELADCRVTRERPGGYGMAAEALASAEQGRATTQPVSGSPRASTTGSRVTGSRIDVSMRIPIDAAAMARYRQVRTEVSEPRS